MSLTREELTRQAEAAEMEEERRKRKPRFRDMCAQHDLKPYVHCHDDKNGCWIVVTGEDALVCQVPDDVLMLPGEPPQAERIAENIARLLTEQLFAACDANGI
jgi:hypothetical protein